MALEIRQQLKLTQQLVMTPQLQQAIKLLQLSRMELVDMVQQELEENPVLEEGMDVEEKDAKEVSEEDSSPEGASEESTEEWAAVDDIDWRTYLEGYNLGSTVGDAYEEDEERPSYENLLTKKTTLTDHLFWQLNLSKISEQQKRIAVEIIGNVDEDGYLKATVDEVSALTESTTEEVEKVLTFVQSFDPPGVASRNLQECLLKQVRNLGMEGTLVESILVDYVPLIEARKYPAIAKALGVTLDDVLGAAKIISSLDPRPGSPYGQEDVHYISPDIFIYKISDEYVVVLNDEGLPNLRINSFYRQVLSGAAVDAKAGEYIQEKMRAAMWLIKSIHQRQRTIYKVTKSIAKFQREFLEKGIEFLKPLVLRDVAEDIEMHESTISRVTTNKYVQTPQGLFELKYFFNSGISTTEGSSIASESVKNRIRDIIADENPKKPYSDQKIVEILRGYGIDIARRTVTKYREMLGIGSSTERKRLF